MVDTAVLFISPSKRLLEGSEARVNAWNDSLGECLDTDQYSTVYKEFQLNFDKLWLLQNVPMLVRLDIPCIIITK